MYREARVRRRVLPRVPVPRPARPPRAARRAEDEPVAHAHAPRTRLSLRRLLFQLTRLAQGAVGIAGLVAAIYPVASPGGYQLFGRTLPPWQTWPRGGGGDGGGGHPQSRDRTAAAAAAAHKTIVCRPSVKGDGTGIRLSSAVLPNDDAGCVQASCPEAPMSGAASMRSDTGAGTAGCRGGRQRAWLARRQVRMGPFGAIEWGRR